MLEVQTDTVMNSRKKGSKHSEFDWTDFEKDAVDRLQKGDKFGGKDGILAPMIKRLLEASLEGELDHHLSEEKASGKSNRRNGKQSKGLKTAYGKIDLETNRDRSGTFEPQLGHTKPKGRICPRDFVHLID